MAMRISHSWLALVVVINGAASNPGEIARDCNLTYSDCINGTRMVPNPHCVASFDYRGQTYTGCTTDGSASGQPWCSRDKVHQWWSANYEYCTAITCFDAYDDPEIAHPWKSIAQKLMCIEQVQVIMGSADGRMLSFNNGYTEHDNSVQFDLLSSGKWMGAIAIAGAVADGKLWWDDRAAQWFPEWWTHDPRDPRSHITLRDILQFKDGFGSNSGVDPFLLLACTSMSTNEDCAKDIYKNWYRGDPSTTMWSGDYGYNSLHHVLALAMACKATNMSPKQFLERYLYKAADMTDTYTKNVPASADNPNLAGGMVSTMNDIDRFFQKYIGNHVVPKRIADDMGLPYNFTAQWQKESLPGAPRINAMGHRVWWPSRSSHGWGGRVFTSVQRDSCVYIIVYHPDYPMGPRHLWGFIQSEVSRLRINKCTDRLV